MTGITSGVGLSLLEYLFETDLIYEFDWLFVARSDHKIPKVFRNKINVYKSDLTNENYVCDVFHGIDVIIHIAALSSPFDAPDSFEKVNVYGTQKLLDLCKINKLSKIIYISTPSIYFDFKDQYKIKEDFLPEKLINHYARTKFKAENIIIECANTNDIPYIILRPRAIYGKYDQTLLPRLIRVLKKGYFPVFFNGDAMLDMTSSKLLANIICQAIRNDAIGIYNVSNNEPINLLILLKLVIMKFRLKVQFIKIPFGLARICAQLVSVVCARILKYKEPPITEYSLATVAFTQTLDVSKLHRDFDIPIVDTLKTINDTLSEIKND